MNAADPPIDLLDGIATTRSIRRYTDDPVPEGALRDICFAATRAPSGSNRQSFRFIVLTNGSVASEAKQLIAGAARSIWANKRSADGYDQAQNAGGEEGENETSTRRSTTSAKDRLARSMDEYVARIDKVPALIFPCLIRHRAPTSTEGASVYPAMQNMLLAARALGFGGVTTMWHLLVEDELRSLLHIPADVFIAATLTLGRPAGGHGPVRRRPLSHFVYDGVWGQTPAWAVDPPGTPHTGLPPAR